MYSFYTWFALSFDADAEIYYGTGKATFPVLYGSCIPMRLSLELFVFSIANGQKHWTAHQQCNQQRKDPVFCWQPDAFSVVGPLAMLVTSGRLLLLSCISVTCTTLFSDGTRRYVVRRQLFHYYTCATATFYGRPM